MPRDKPELFNGVPGLLNSIGLNATLVTDDDKLVLVKRNPRMSSGRSGWHISVNEGMLPEDCVRDGELDPRVGLVRGVKEELGIDIDPRCVKIHTAMLDMRRYQFGLLGHIDLRGSRTSAAHVQRARMLGNAKDKSENARLSFIDWTYEDVRSKLLETEWIAHGWLNLILSAIQHFPSHRDELSDLLTDRTVSFNARADAVRASRD